MKKIRILSVTFDTPIEPYEIPAFRGAIIEKVGLQYDIFHNHNNQESAHRYHYRYPMVQYKLIRKKPTMVFVEHGIEEAQHFFTQADWNLQFAQRTYQTSIEKLLVRQYGIGLAEEFQTYSVRRWMALNQKNYQKYMELDSLADKISMLENLLAAHILSMAKGVGHRFQDRFQIAIDKVFGSQFLPFEGVKVLTFDLRFKANLYLPPYLGIGKGTSVGFGTLHKVKQAANKLNTII
jgi:hypothetical protein